jgi:hypothetical protein
VARTATVSALLSSLRLLGDYKNEVSEAAGSYGDDYMSDATLIGFLSDAYQLAYQELADADEGWNSVRYTLSIVGGSGSYDVPSDFYKPVAVEVQDPSPTTGWRPLPYATLDDDVGPQSLDLPRAWRLVANQIEIVPTPQSSSTSLRLTYVPEPAALSATTDTIVDECGLGHLTVLGALRLAAGIREDRPIGTVEVLYREQLARSIRSLRRRNRAAPRRLRDPRESGVQGFPWRRW